VTAPRTGLPELRILTVRQPFAGLLAGGVKSVELRSRPTRYRGLVAIHAALRRD
jgi:hypothetical protein